MNVQWRRETLYLLVLAMDTCWLAPLAAIISGLVDLPPLPLTELLVLYLAAFWSGRLVIRLHLDERRSQVVAIYLAAMTILVVLKVAHYGAYPWLSLDWLARLVADLAPMFTSVPPAIFTIIVGVAIWWNGLRLSVQHMSRALVAGHFTAGLMIFVFVLLLGAMRGVGDLSAPIFVFFAVGLMAVSMARMESMTSGRHSPLDGYWLTLLLLVIILVMGTGLVVMDAFSAAGAGGDSVMAALSAIARVVGGIIVLLVTPFGYLAYWLILLLERLVGRSNQVIAPIDIAPSAPARTQELQTPELPFIVEQILRALPMIIILIVAVWLLGKALNRRRTPLDDGSDEVRESAGTFRDFWNDVSGFLKRLFGLAGKGARRGMDAMAGVLHAGDSDPALTVRQIYGRLLHLAASHGAARRAEQTPFEYLPDMLTALSGAGEDATAITETYVRARYSCTPPASQQVLETRAAWERIRKGPAEKR
jgi:hypothetical protein